MPFKQAFISLVTIGLMGSFQTVHQSQNKIVWNKMSHDFGILSTDSIVETSFVCYNKSDTTFIIENVHWSCSCTVPSWNREPMQPGDSAAIKVKFNSHGKSGHQEKVIAIYSNQGLFELVLKADIRRKP